MSTGQIFQGSDRPDWVLHLPPSPVNLLKVRTIHDYPRDDGIDDEFTSFGPHLLSLSRDLNDPGARLDRRNLGLSKLDASFSSLQDPETLKASIINPLSGDRKVQLPKTLLEVIENGFRYESTVLDGNASVEARKAQNYLAQHPNAALQAEEQSVYHWLIAGSSGLQWNQRALGLGITELNLTNCNLNADSIPALVSYIEGNGTLRDLNLWRNRLLSKPGPAALLARSFRSSVVAELNLSWNTVDDKAASLHAFLANLNSTCLHTLRLSNILSQDKKRYDPNWEDEDDSEDEDGYSDEEDDGAQARRSAQEIQEDQAFLALSAFVRRSIPFRVEHENGTGGEELAPSYCGCPNLTSITWDENESHPRDRSGRGQPQPSTSLVLMTAVIGYLSHLKYGTALAFAQPAESFIGQAILKGQAQGAMKDQHFPDRSLMPSGSLRWTTFAPRVVDQARPIVDTPSIRDMFRSVRAARQNAPGHTGQGSALAGSESQQVQLEAAVDRDTMEFERAILAIASLGGFRRSAVKFHSIWLDILQKELRRSAFAVLAAARTVGCQVGPTRKNLLPGWMRLPPEIRSHCMHFLDEINIPKYGDLRIGHALSRSQMQTILSFASDRRTIGYGKINEVLLASKRLADEAAQEATHVTPSDESRGAQSQTVDLSTVLQSGIFVTPKWSWKKAAKRCIPQDWATQAASNKERSGAGGATGPKPRNQLPPEALAFLSVTDCVAFRNA